MQGYFGGEMGDKLSEAMDPNNDYTYEQFMEDYGGNQLTVENPDALIKIPLSFVNKSNNPDPEYATKGSSGFDLRANLDKLININSGERKIIPTGIYFDIPENFEIQVRPRSGLAAKYGITVLNTPGTIDADYRGEIKVILINHGVGNFEINHGDRIAQAVVAPVYGKNIIDLNKVDSISEDTERGAGGFGSTGTK